MLHVSCLSLSITEPNKKRWRETKFKKQQQQNVQITVILVIELNTCVPANINTIFDSIHLSFSIIIVFYFMRFFCFVFCFCVFTLLGWNGFDTKDPNDYLQKIKTSVVNKPWFFLSHASFRCIFDGKTTPVFCPKATHTHTVNSCINFYDKITTRE